MTSNIVESKKDFSAVHGLRACLLCGGSSRRMGRDKAFLSHPQGGCWLTHSINLCIQIGLPVDVVSANPMHHRLAKTLEGVDCRFDPRPGMGPLAAMVAVLGQVKAMGLMVLPVDMPWLESETLLMLIGAWQEQPSLALVSHDGIRLQPLFAIYPNDPFYRDTLLVQLAADHRSMHDWLEKVPYRTLEFPEGCLRNANWPADLVELGE